MRWLANIVLLLLLALVGAGVLMTLRTPAHLYAFTGKFAGCPERPSCVSSMAGDAVHGIAPLHSDLPRAATMQRLREAVQAMGGEIEHDMPGYLHAVFRTPKMRFRDDVELLYRDGGRIELRSISRIGYRDFGVNRQRMEALRRRFDDAPAG